MNTIFALSLVLSLGSPDYAAREQATTALGKLQPEVFLKWGAGHKDAEIAARSRKLLDAYYWQVADTILPSKWPYMPWIDSLPYTYPKRYPTINQYLGTVNRCPSIGYGSPDAPHWYQYRQATKHLVVHLFRQGKTKAQITALLDAMAEYEKNWIIKNRASYEFPQKILEAVGK